MAADRERHSFAPNPSSTLLTADGGALLTSSLVNDQSTESKGSPDPSLSPPGDGKQPPVSSQNSIKRTKGSSRESDHSTKDSSIDEDQPIMSGYIARVRYENPLPPPAFPPKLLDIPGTGLASSQYLTPGYTTRMWREQPLNIEADAELGMPLDLVGMPGIFDGDESSIQAPDHPPAIDPRDKAILRKPHQLGKPTSNAAGVSFLRRTEYISQEANRPRGDSAGVGQLKRTNSAGKKRRQSEITQDDPINILKTLVKGFDIAYPEEAYTGPDTTSNIQGHKATPAEVDAWNHPEHPTKKNLRVIDSYPVLPDLEAFPDSGGYMIMKFATNPLATTDSYDNRLDVGLLRPLELREDINASHQAAIQAHQADPSKPAPGPPPFDYEFSIPTDRDNVKNIKKAFDVNDSDMDNPDLYDTTNKETGEKSFRYSRVRAYETAVTSGSFHQKYDEIALALHDPSPESREDGAKKQKAAYYYPILQKSQIRPRRSLAQRMGMVPSRRPADEKDENRVDVLDISVRDADDSEASRRAEHKAMYDVVEGDADAEGDATEADQESGLFKEETAPGEGIQSELQSELKPELKPEDALANKTEL